MRRAPAAERNKEPILQVLKTILPQTVQKVLEIASGTGQHIVHFAQAFPQTKWQPTEVDNESIDSISAFIEHYDMTDKVSQPQIVDVTEPPTKWHESVLSQKPYDVIICSNMIHITPFKCTVGLFEAASYLLKPNGLLLTYGPYSVNGVLEPESNVNFNMMLKKQNPEWGVRDIKELIEVGTRNRLQFIKQIDMPANNKVLIFQKLADLD